MTRVIENLRGSRLRRRGAALASSHLPTPIYVQLVTLFRRRIETGEWKIGQQIPTLDELSAEFGVARATVRQAIGFLESEGLIGRYRGRGTFVLKPELRDLARHSDRLVAFVDRPRTSRWSGWNAVARGSFRRRRIRAGSLRPPISSCAACTAATAFPTWWARPTWSASLFDRIGKKGFNDAPFRVLHREADDQIGRAEQTIVVGTADLETANLLDVALNSPIVIVTRSVFDTNDVLIHESDGRHRGDLVRVRMRLR